MSLQRGRLTSRFCSPSGSNTSSSTSTCSCVTVLSKGEGVRSPVSLRVVFGREGRLTLLNHQATNSKEPCTLIARAIMNGTGSLSQIARDIPSGKGMWWYTHNCVDNLRALPLPSLGIDPGTWKSRRHAKYGSVGFQPPMRETPASTGITVTGFGLQPPPEIRSNRQLLGCHCPRWEPSTARCSPISPGTCPEATQERARAPRLPSLRISRTGDGS